MSAKGKVSQATAPFWVILGLLFLAPHYSSFAQKEETSTPKLPPSTISTRLEAFSRINPDLLSRSAKLQALVSETAAALQNDARLVDLVIRFGLPDQNNALIEIALGNHPQEVKDRAIAFILSHPIDDHTKERLENSPKGHDLLARNGSELALDILWPVLQKPGNKQETRRKLIQTLCSKRNAAVALINKIQDNRNALPAELVQWTKLSLAQTPWSTLSENLPTVASDLQANAESRALNIQALVGKTGDAESGRAIFLAPENTCTSCHTVNDKGSDFGPGLSEIGKKLGKDALFDAILNPSAGISFDYEGWNITLNSGDEITGIVLSRTETHWTVKNLLGQIQEIPLEDIFEKQKMSTSLMPAGLGELLGPEKLVDLVAYLSTLGK